VVTKAAQTGMKQADVVILLRYTSMKVFPVVVTFMLMLSELVAGKKKSRSVTHRHGGRHVATGVFEHQANFQIVVL
jgi:hypothetical protein